MVYILCGANLYEFLPAGRQKVLGGHVSSFCVGKYCQINLRGDFKRIWGTAKSAESSCGNEQNIVCDLGTLP